MSKCACHLTDRVTGEKYEIKDANARRQLEKISPEVEEIKKAIDSLTGTDSEALADLLKLRGDLTALAEKVEGKVTKKGIGEYSRVYAVTADGKESAIRYSISTNASALVQRDADGLFKVKDPVESAHPTPKKYVDAIRTDFTNLSTEVSNINADLTSLSTRLVNHQNEANVRYNNTNEAIEALNTEIESLSASVESVLTPSWVTAFNANKRILGIGLKEPYFRVLFSNGTADYYGICNNVSRFYLNGVNYLQTYVYKYGEIGEDGGAVVYACEFFFDFTNSQTGQPNSTKANIYRLTNGSWHKTQEPVTFMDLPTATGNTVSDPISAWYQ